VILIIYSSSLSRSRVALPAIPKIQANLLEIWEKSGNLVLVMSDLSRDDYSTVFDFTRRHFGKYVSKTVTTKKGKVLTFKHYRVGYKILPVGLVKGNIRFDIILYRRDLASLRHIKRPWRTIGHKSGTLEPLRSAGLIRLPDWILADERPDE